jgi:hypothetical protein
MWHPLPEVVCCLSREAERLHSIKMSQCISGAAADCSVWRSWPSHMVGAISLVVLAIAILAGYVFHLAGAWRGIYVVIAAIALYLNVFVLVVQGFSKVPALKAMAPTQQEPRFLVAQLVVLALFIVLTIFAVKKFPSEHIVATA